MTISLLPECLKYLYPESGESQKSIIICASVQIHNAHIKGTHTYYNESMPKSVHKGREAAPPGQHRVL